MESFNLGSIEFESPLLASSSYATATLKDLQTLNRTAIGGIITKSATILARQGNPEPNFFTEGDITINAQGLPGPSLLDTLTLLEKFSAERTKPLILSMAGLQPHEYREIIDIIAETSGQLYDAIELNLSCPNVAGKPIISYDHDIALALIDQIAGRFPKLPLGLKLAPHFSAAEEAELQDSLNNYLADHRNGAHASFGNQRWFDRSTLREFARKLSTLQERHRNLCFVSATNTLPNCRIIKPNGESAIHPEANNGQGGLSGKFLRDISVANVRVLAEELQPDIKVIGTGGISDGKSAQQYFDAGADAIAIGTSLINRGPRVVQEILADL